MYKGLSLFLMLMELLKVDLLEQMEEKCECKACVNDRV